VCAGLPGEKINSMWRNDIDEVAEFFYKMFGQRFLIINLSGVGYDYSKFAFRVRDFAFPDHSCPPLEVLLVESSLCFFKLTSLRFGVVVVQDN